MNWNTRYGAHEKNAKRFGISVHFATRRKKSIPKIKNGPVKTPNDERDPPNKPIRQFRAKDSAQKPKRIIAKLLFFVQREKRRDKFADPPNHASKQESNQKFQLEMLGAWKGECVELGQSILQKRKSTFSHSFAWERRKAADAQRSHRGIYGKVHRTNGGKRE
ncbi:MAG: hypothetical protein ACLFRG_05155 [Desulfococcaceae bacterium]